MYNILIIGATGVGKSTLLNKIANKDIANIGYGVTPETKTLDKHALNSSITIWDSPGLGEAIKKDEEYEKNLRNILKKGSSIDFILIIIDIKNKSIETVRSLIKSILNMDKNYSDKFIFILNKVDEAKNFRYWDNKNNIPTSIQVNEIKEKINDYKKRIEESTKIKINLFLSCSAESGYNIHTINNSIYSYILAKHLKER